MGNLPPPSAAPGHSPPIRPRQTEQGRRWNCATGWIWRKSLKNPSNLKIRRGQIDARTQSLNYDCTLPELKLVDTVFDTGNDTGSLRSGDAAYTKNQSSRGIAS